MIDNDDDDDVDFKENASIEDDVQPEADIKKGKKKGEMKQANPVIEIEDSLTKKSKEANNEIETKPIIDAQIEKNPTGKKETKIKEHDGGNQVNLSDDEGPKIKTAAQKKAEKKEREKEKKKAEKAKKKGKAPDASDKKALTEEGDNVLIDKVDDKSQKDGKEVNEDTEPTAGREQFSQFVVWIFILGERSIREFGVHSTLGIIKGHLSFYLTALLVWHILYSACCS